MKGFSITRGSIARASGQIHLAEDSVNTNLKITLEDNFQAGICNVDPLLRNLGYNNTATQNQNVFQDIYCVLVL